MNTGDFGKFVPHLPPKQRSDGERSRQAILQAAAQLVSVKGLAGLSIGALAEFLGMSKSGLFAHFGSKEELELATIETAVEIFSAEVLQPSMSASPGLSRLLSLVDGFLSHLGRRVFPGGCFFAGVAAELDTRPGRAHDRVVELQRSWLEMLAQCLRDAQGAGEIDRKADLTQVLFEVAAMLLGANFSFAMSSDPQVLRQARRGVDDVLARAMPARKPASGRARRGGPAGGGVTSKGSRGERAAKARRS